MKYVLKKNGSPIAFFDEMPTCDQLREAFTSNGIVFFDYFNSVHELILNRKFKYTNAILAKSYIFELVSEQEVIDSKHKEVFEHIAKKCDAEINNIDNKINGLKNSMDKWAELHEKNKDWNKSTHEFLDKCDEEVKRKVGESVPEDCDEVDGNYKLTIEYWDKLHRITSINYFKDKLSPEQLLSAITEILEDDPASDQFTAFINIDGLERCESILNGEMYCGQTTDKLTRRPCFLDIKFEPDESVNHEKDDCDDDVISFEDIIKELKHIRVPFDESFISSPLYYVHKVNELINALEKCKKNGFEIQPQITVKDNINLYHRLCKNTDVKRKQLIERLENIFHSFPKNFPKIVANPNHFFHGDYFDLLNDLIKELKEGKL